MVGNDVAVIGKPLAANAADAVLSHNLAIEKFAHLCVGVEFPVSTRMVEIIDAPNAHLTLMSSPRDCLPATAGEGAMHRAELTATEPHGVLLVGRKANDGFWGIRIERKGNTATGANDPRGNMDGAVAISGLA